MAAAAASSFEWTPSFSSTCWTCARTVPVPIFSREAIDYADGVSPQRVILVDGPELAQLMIDHGVGVSVATTYEIKRIDVDYFDADENLA